MPAVQLQWALPADDRWPGTNIKAELRVGTVQPEAHKISVTSILEFIPVLSIIEKNAVCGLRSERQQDVKVKVDISQRLEAHV